jgi:hypothetical protein
MALIVIPEVLHGKIQNLSWFKWQWWGSVGKQSYDSYEYWINNYLLISGRVFQQTVDIPMGINCALLFVFLNSYEADFIQVILKNNEKKLVWSFNFTFRYIYDVLSLNNSRFCDFVHRIYPAELEIKDTTETERYASYLDLHLEIDSDGRLRTKLYYKRYVFNFFHYIPSIDI